VNQEQLKELKGFIEKQVNNRYSKDFKFWGGIVALLLIILFWGALIEFNRVVETKEFKIDPKTYAWDHVFHLFVEKYEYEKSLFADVESRNIVLESMIDDIFYLNHKDDMFLTYFQKADIIRRDMIRRSDCDDFRKGIDVEQ
jgi:hypothetical protein